MTDFKTEYAATRERMKEGYSEFELPCLPLKFEPISDEHMAYLLEGKIDGYDRNGYFKPAPKVQKPKNEPIDLLQLHKNRMLKAQRTGVSILPKKNDIFSDYKHFVKAV